MKEQLVSVNMYKHYDLIGVFANDKYSARNKVSEFLLSYNKKKIHIIGVQGKNRRYEVEVEYYDKYEECAVYLSDDFEEQKRDPLTLVYDL